MTREELIRELEFYRDLGLSTLYLPEAAPVAESKAAARPEAASATPGVRPSAAAPVAAPADEGARPAKPSPSPAVARPANPLAAPPAAGSPLQLRSLAFSAKPAMSDAASMSKMPTMFSPPTMFDALGVDPKEDSLARIREDIGDCKRCRLCQGRNKIVFGSGNEAAKLVFVGEGPGEDEDNTGLPFVGRAGQLLTKMIEGTAEREGIPVKRKDVYICNVVKCRPPNNRKPGDDEMEICGQFLFRQLAVLNPKAICVLGATAAQALLNSKERIGKMRGNWFQWREIPVMVTYHPSYLLRAYNADAKREAWEDLKQVLHRVYDDPANLP
jgi:DNA polymerase